jgi:uncharacterized protein YndB with AHSA1/START domain
MGLEADGRTIRWRVHLAAPPERVHQALATAEGRARFWAASAPERDDVILFRFASGQVLESRILQREAPRRFVVTYFGGSRVEFDLAADGAGGTDLTLTETGGLEAELLENLPGWVSVLLGLKAAVDFGVDLRNRDPSRQWEQGYVDV